MIKNKTLASIFTLFLLLPIAFLGCSGGSSDTTVLDTSPVKSSQAIKILPSSYDFGSVTPNNSPEPLEAEIVNEGSGSLSVENIFLSDAIEF